VSLYLETWHYLFLSTIMNYALSQQHLCFYICFMFDVFRNFELAVGIDRQSERLIYETDS